MTPTEEQLKAADCLFSTDKVGGAEMYAFKRAARYGQHRWAVDDLGITEFGTHRGRGSGTAGPEIRNGTKLRDVDADAGANFLSDRIHEVAKGRLETKQDSETLDAYRLQRDLLSSMPMAFNLFGEAAGEPEAQRALGDLLAPNVEGPVEILFEWSPERRSEKYTRDRTAFDVVMLIGDPRGPRTVVGIETKYHEHSAREAKPKPAGTARHEDQTSWLMGIAVRSGAFREGWEEQVLNTDLRQIWRDHLLALSMRQHPDEWADQSRYVLVYPSRNVSFADAASRYASVLQPNGNSFTALTVEEVVDAAFAHGGSTKERFRRRYLW